MCRTLKNGFRSFVETDGWGVPKGIFISCNSRLQRQLLFWEIGDSSKKILFCSEFCIFWAAPTQFFYLVFDNNQNVTFLFWCDLCFM